jgi:hypothetical protein
MTSNSLLRRSKAIIVAVAVTLATNFAISNAVEILKDGAFPSSPRPSTVSDEGGFPSSPRPSL